MKKLLLLFTMILAAFSINAQNLLETYNEGFEGINAGASGNTPYYWWNFYNDTAANAILTDETTIVHSGGHAAKVAIGTAAASYQPQLANGRTLTLIEGNSYTVTFWIIGTVGGGTVQVSDNGANTYGPNMTVTTSWQQYSQTFLATADNVGYQLWIHLGGFVDTYYVDDAAVVDSTLGLESVNTTGSIAIYPNPVTDRLIIKPSRLQANSIIINDILGRKVKTINNAKNITSIDVSNLPKGMYILTTDTNKQFKFLKE